MLSENVLRLLEIGVFSCAVPLVYIFIILFVIFLVRAAKDELRIRSYFGIFAGILGALAFLILDITTTGLAELSIDPTNVLVVLPFGLIGSIIGFIILLMIDIFLRRGAISFVVLFIVWAGAVSAYFLIRATELKGIISISTVSFLFGNIVYIMANFGIIRSVFNLAGSETENKGEKNRWAI
jgi:hypothetical protein